MPISPAQRRSVVRVVVWGLLTSGLGCSMDQTSSTQPMPITEAPSVQSPSEPLASGPVPFPKLPAGAGEIAEGASQEFTTTKTGLKYRILREGDGKKPTVINTVLAHYHGWLDSGKVFDSSYARGKPISFPLNQVVEGWRDGIPFCAEGGMIELEIPSKLGYGARGAGGAIPPNATLHFLVELKEVR